MKYLRSHLGEIVFTVVGAIIILGFFFAFQIHMNKVCEDLHNKPLAMCRNGDWNSY